MRACLHFRLLSALFAAGLAGIACDARAQVVWTGNGAGSNVTTPANWSGGVPPVNDGTVTFNFPAVSQQSVDFNANANAAGIFFTGPSFSSYYFFGSGTLTIGSGGISSDPSVNAYLDTNVAINLSANQTWDGSTGYIFDTASVGETGGPATLTVAGQVYLLANNTFSGGLVVAPGANFYIGQMGAGLGPVTIGDNATFESWFETATVPGNVALGNNVTLATVGFASNANTLTFNGTVTLAQPEHDAEYQ